MTRPCDIRPCDIRTLDIVHVGIEDNLQQHARMICRTAEGLVGVQQISDVKGINYAAKKADMVRFRDFFTKERRKKLALCLIVEFKL